MTQNKTSFEPSLMIYFDIKILIQNSSQKPQFSQKIFRYILYKKQLLPEIRGRKLKHILNSN